MASLPTGTVTFLFSDVEGSTELVEGTCELVPSGLQELGGLGGIVR